jgi:mannose-6-phosphate isomerase-like protein (cupin superfamily)
MAPAHHRVEEMSQMPKVSKESVTEVRDYGVAEDRTGNLDGYTVNFVSIRQDHDLAPMLSGLPGGRCPCPHWGYVLKGRMIVRYADHEEVCEAGDAFYMPPGHTPAAEAGTEFIQISPSDQLQEVEAAVVKAMQQMQGA